MFWILIIINSFSDFLAVPKWVSEWMEESWVIALNNQLEKRLLNGPFLFWFIMIIFIFFLLEEKLILKHKKLWTVTEFLSPCNTNKNIRFNVIQLHCNVISLFTAHMKCQRTRNFLWNLYILFHVTHFSFFTVNLTLMWQQRCFTLECDIFNFFS